MASSVDIAEQQEQSKNPTKIRKRTELKKFSQDLDSAHSGCRRLEDFFSSDLQSNRKRFQEECQRLIFLYPILCGRKVEDLLWRKAYYDVIVAVRQLKKKEYTPEDIRSYVSHIDAGITYYDNFIAKLEFHLQNQTDPSHINQAQLSIHSSLICLGDLNRYKLEVSPDCDKELAIEFYLKAICYKPEYGLPRNQLGVLAASDNNYLDAVYYYMCSLDCKHSCALTEGNLQAAFQKNCAILNDFLPKDYYENDLIHLQLADLEKRTISQFLFLVGTCFYNIEIDHFDNLCVNTAVDLYKLLNYSIPIASEKDKFPIHVVSEDSEYILSPTRPTHDTFFKIVVLCLLSISKLKQLQSPELSMMIHFTLSLCMALIENVINHISDKLLYITLPPNAKSETILNQTSNAEKDTIKQDEEKPKVERKVRRRRNKRSSKRHSDISGTKVIDNSDSAPKASKKSSDNLLVTFKSTEEKYTKLAEKARKINSTVMLEILAEERLLPTIKILSDWILSDTTVLINYRKYNKDRLRLIAKFLNFLNVDTDSDLIETAYRTQIPLPEDRILNGVQFIFGWQNIFNWNNKTLSSKEETQIRITRLVALGYRLTKINQTGLRFNSEQKLFILGEPTMSATDIEKRMQLTKRLGELWICGEIALLQIRVDRLRRMQLPPYLVTDTDCLAENLSLVKKLVKSQMFIVVVPFAVILALDYLKSQKQVRDAIRWLEVELMDGNPFCRVQRPEDTTPLSFITNSDKRSKKMCTYIEIFAYCEHLKQKYKETKNVVTVLLGGKSLSTLEYRQIRKLADTTKIKMESILFFRRRWIRSCYEKKQLESC